MSPLKTSEPPAFETMKPLQFSLRSLLMLITISAVVLGICKTLDIGFVSTICLIGIVAFMSLIPRLMYMSRGKLIVVYQTMIEYDALLCRDYLNENGIEARTCSEQLGGFTGMNISPMQVVVLVEKADRARKLSALL
jgi:hypothetical protein